MRQARIFFLIAILAGWMAACQGSSPDQRKDIIDTVQKNLAAAQAEDVGAYMDTIHPESPNYHKTEELMKSLFEKYDLAFELEKVTVLEHTVDQANVEFVQVVKSKNPSSDFRDQRVTGTHGLQKDENGNWKLHAVKITDVEYLKK